ncbi:CBS domain-containing protein [Iamia sp. SCSIO 61187]|uniref:CBS domain-containing protein n=1 Tax=Iamia sp. SCSIO 61187 TaxID=2722752 RepID=UPI001C634FEF|nr:CBS domain-containing protein [Iamia sp. SCSIO 61187]QYG93126.1 CBS domain-containing protein [Iamia sp. SCSIO 61187]
MHVAGLLRRKGDDVATVASSATIGEVVAALADRGVGALVVSDDGRVVDGIVSERDVTRGLAAHGSALLDHDVASIMTRDVVTCDMSTTVDELSALMTEGRMRHVPVVVDGALCGIVSIGDVVKAYIRDLEQEKQTLHEYISQGR